MSMKRRTFLKSTLATSALGIAVSAGLLKPKEVLAAWPESAFASKSFDDALAQLFDTSNVADSGDIKIKAPDIAENGAVVPITISTTLSNVENISVFVDKNPQPLAANFDLTSNVSGFVSTRIKMRETSDVIAIIKSGGKLYKANKTVKVTIGGCGG